MINSKANYEDAGRKSAKARHNHDEATARFHYDWYMKAKRLESQDDQYLAESYFTNAYKEERNYETGNDQNVQRKSCRL